MTIEQLTVTIRELIAERQALRDRGASQEVLERNRLEIVHRQQELSYMWIESHRPGALPRAA
jgi:hypothetical protein